MNEAYFSNAYNLLLPTGQVNQTLSYFTLPASQEPPSEIIANQPVEPSLEINTPTPQPEPNLNYNEAIG